MNFFNSKRKITLGFITLSIAVQIGCIVPLPRCLQLGKIEPKGEGIGINLNEAASASLRRAEVTHAGPLDSSDSKWLGLKTITWVDETGALKKWESAVRKREEINFAKDTPDAVAILPILSRPGSPKSVVLVCQFRPAVGKYVVELPAGLVDPKETIESTAIRELFEETGYGEGEHGGKVSIEKVSNIFAKDPGMTGANLSVVKVNINIKSADSPPPVPKPAPGENIEVLVVPLEELHETLNEWSKVENCMIDGGLGHLALGLSLGLN